MVKIFDKKKKTELFANGRILVTPFKKLKVEYFPDYKKGDMFFINRYTGDIFIDSLNKANEPIISLLKVLSEYPAEELKKWENEQKEKHPEIKDVSDLKSLKDNTDEFMKVFAAFLVPFELMSRELQKEYYRKKDN